MSGRASHALLQGRLEDSKTLAHDALTHRFKGHDRSAAYTFEMQMFFVRREQGDFEEIIETVTSSAEPYVPYQGADRSCILAYAYAQLACAAQTRQQLEVAGDNLEDLPRDAYWLLHVSLLSEAVVFLGDEARARLLYELLLPYADRVITNILLTQGSASRLLGLLATTLSRYEDAARHFEDALAMNAQIRSPLWIAHTHHAYAHMLLRRDQPGDRDRARTLVDDALATADRLGLKALANKTRSLKLTTQAPAGQPAPARPA